MPKPILKLHNSGEKLVVSLFFFQNESGRYVTEKQQYVHSCKKCQKQAETTNSIFIKRQASIMSDDRILTDLLAN